MTSLYEHIDKWKTTLVDTNGEPVKGLGFICSDPGSPSSGDIYEIMLPACGECGNATRANDKDCNLELRILMWKVDRFVRFNHFDSRGVYTFASEGNVKNAQSLDSRCSLERYVAWRTYKSKEYSPLLLAEAPAVGNQGVVLPFKEPVSPFREVCVTIFAEFNEAIAVEGALGESPEDVDLTGSDAMLAVTRLLDLKQLHVPHTSQRRELYVAMHLHANVLELATPDNFAEAIGDFYSTHEVEHAMDASIGPQYDAAMTGLYDVVCQASFERTFAIAEGVIVKKSAKKIKPPPVTKPADLSSLPAKQYDFIFIDKKPDVFMCGATWPDIMEYWVLPSEDDATFDEEFYPGWATILPYVTRTYFDKRGLFDQGRALLKRAIKNAK